MSEEDSKTTQTSTPTPGLSKEEVNAIVQERLARQKASLTALHESEIAGLQQEIAELKQKAIEVAEKHKQELEAEKQALAELKTRYDSVIAREQERLAEQKRALPKEVAVLLDKQSYEDQLKWLEEYGSSIVKPSPKAPPSPPSPSGNEMPKDSDLVQLKRESGIYSSF